MSTSPTPNYDIGAYISKSVEMFTKDIGNWILIGVVGFFALGVGAWGGYHNCALKALRGEKPTVNDVLMPFSRFGDFIMPMLLIFGAFVLTVCLFGIGGILLATWWFFAYPLMIERGIGWSEATKLSKEVASQNLVMTFVVMFLAGLIGNVAGVVGLSFLTAALSGIIAVFAYVHVFHGTIPGAAPALPGGGAPYAPPAGQPPQQWSAPSAAPAAQSGWAPPAQAPAAPQAWAAPAPAAPQGWAAPAPAAPQAWAAPAPAAPQAWAAPAPGPLPGADSWPEPAPAAQSWSAPAAPAPAPAPAPAAPLPGVETATQAAGSADEAYVGKTVAMSAIDFENMLNPKK